MDSQLNEIFVNAREAARKLNLLDDATKNSLLLTLADAIGQHTAAILDANAKDLAKMAPENPKYDRLKLTEARLAGIAGDMRNVASLPSPLDKVLMESVLPNGLKIRKVSVPFGVIGVIYEARPNVSFDVFSLCFKSGSACVLKGGSDAIDSNRAIVQLIRSTLKAAGIDENVVQLLPPSHQATAEMLHAVGYIDLIIPRGSKNLIEFVRDNSRVPVIETGAGICHTYFHTSGDIEKGRAIVNNAKTRRVSVCNALDCLLVDAARISDLASLVEPLAASKVVIYADEKAYNALDGVYPMLEHASDENWGREYMDYKMSLRIVDGIDNALAHIARYTSHHSESIVAEDADACKRFTREVDAACVYTNAPTSFTDGAQFGFGAEIGISTQKLHARGPMALPEITTYKYIIEGEGQTRNN